MAFVFTSTQLFKYPVSKNRSKDKVKLKSKLKLKISFKIIILDGLVKSDCTVTKKLRLIFYEYHYFKVTF